MAEEVATEESSVLSQDEVAEVVSGESTEPEVQLPSDENKFEVPDKFKDKSIEDVIKSYQELEKMKGGDASKEEKVENTTEETLTEVKEEQYQKYAESLDKNGELSADEYSELAKQGYDKATVDAEIQRRSELQEFQQFQKDKQLNSIIEPLGGGAEKFEAVSKWSAENKSEEEIKTFNDTLASVPPLAKQAMLKGLYAEYDADAKSVDTILHTNSPQTTPSKGYATQEDFFKDVGSPEYQNNPKFREAVEKKMSKSDIF